jgi:hypothetical protein
VLGSEKHFLVIVALNANEGVLEVREEAAEAEGEWDARLFFLLFFFQLGNLVELEQCKYYDKPSSNKASKANLSTI